MKASVMLVAAPLLALGIAGQVGLAADLKIDFQKHIAPLIREKCMPCHDPDQRQGEFRLNNRTNLLRGGSSGSAIVAGDSSASLLIQRISGSDKGPQMPLTGPLSDEEIERFRAWIDQGAPWEGRLEAVAQKLEVSAGAAALFKAIRDGDRKAIVSALDAEPSLANSRDEDGSSALMLATIYSDIETMQDLLGRDADPNATNTFGATALMWATDDFDKAKLLVDGGADVNARDEDGFTASMAAAETSAGFRTLQLLISKGADVKAELANGTNLLHIAAGAGVLPSVEFLLGKGLDVNSRRRNGATALLSALDARRADVAKLLLKKGADPNLTQRDGSSPIGAASSAGDLESVVLLLESGADINQRGFGNYTPLMWAAYSYQPNYKLVEWLVEHDADTAPEGQDNQTARSLAERKNDQKLLQLLAAVSK